MAKPLLSILPLLLLFLTLPPARGAGSPLEMLKRDCGTEELKRAVDLTPPADLNAADEEGKTALFYCRHLGATMLLLAGADPDARANDGRTPAFRAVSPSRDPALPILLELLLLKHADPNARDKDGCTLLAWAAHEGNLPAVKLLLLAGADPAPPDAPADRTPLFFALRRQDEKMAAALRAPASGTPGKTAGEPLAAAVRAARLDEINGDLAAGDDPNARDQDGATALLRAIAARRANVAALLLLKGANPNLADNKGVTPLMQCATGFDMASERMLVELIVAGANVNAVAKDGTTALSQAVHCRNNTAAQWMIWRGASLDVHSPDGTLMQGASLNPDSPSMLALLKAAGLTEEASPVTKEKSFALIEAVRAGDFPAVEAMLQNGTPADLPGQYERTALEWAACYDRFDLVDLLVRHGADINHQHSYNGEHLIHTWAAGQNTFDGHNAKLIKAMADRGANPNLAMKDGNTPLMLAARDGAAGPKLDLLLQLAADLNARNKEGHTALGLARQHGHTKTAKLLADKGAAE